MHSTTGKEEMKRLISSVCSAWKMFKIFQQIPTGEYTVRVATKDPGPTTHPWLEWNEYGNSCHYPGCKLVYEEHEHRLLYGESGDRG